MLQGILAILIGYLLGSVSPAYFLGRILKGIDIRKQRGGNAGATNVYHVLGLWPAVVTVIIDLSKGAGAILLTSLFAPTIFTYFAGIAAVLGHVFPFYLKFKAGQGGATAAGILIYFLVLMGTNHWLSWTAILVVLISGLIFIYITKIGPLCAFPLLFLIIFSLLEMPINLTTGFFLVLIIFALFQIVRLSFKWRAFFVNKISKEQQKELLRWRTLMRPLAILIPIFYILFGKVMILVLIGSVGSVFVLMDLSRLSFKKINVFLLRGSIVKKREQKVFSSMSFFMLACFIILLIFEKNIAIIAILFLIFGDLAAKFMGILFGRRKLFRKSLEGFLAYFAACLLFGFLVTYFLEVSFLMILIGAMAAAIVEVVPIGIDDNFTVGLISASAMYLLKMVGIG